MSVCSTTESASYAPAMTDREHLHELVDALPEDVTAEVLALISGLVQADDGHLGENELTALEEADAAVAAGKVRPLSEARPDLDV